MLTPQAFAAIIYPVMTIEQTLKLDELNRQIALMKGRIEHNATNKLKSEADLRQHLVDIFAEMQNWQESITQVQFPDLYLNK